MKKIIIVLLVLLLILGGLLMREDYETLYLYDGPDEALFKIENQAFNVFYSGLEKVRKVEVKTNSDQIEELIFTEEIVIPRNLLDAIDNLENHFLARQSSDLYKSEDIDLNYYVSHDKFVAVTTIDCTNLKDESFIEIYRLDRAMSDQTLDYNQYMTVLKEMGFKKD